MRRPFAQVDVFGASAGCGNPVAVVLDATGLSAAAMQDFARWTDLSETTFVLPPGDAGAHYRVRIFTPDEELPFAGHPTLGTCHAWLEAAGGDAAPDVVVQRCPAGDVPIRRIDGRLAFAAPPVTRTGPVDEPLVARLAAAIGVARPAVVDAQWVDNGPGWVALLLEDAQAVLDVHPQGVDVPLGLVGPTPAAAEHAFEVRAFYPLRDMCIEDPVTGSLNASLAQWLTATGRAHAPYTARQGTAIGRHGIVHVSAAHDALWIGGSTATVVRGTVDL